MTEKFVPVAVNGSILDVADAGGLKFSPAKGVRTIYWTLPPNNEWFWPENHPGNPAFGWIDSAPDDVFPWPPKIFAAGKKLVIDNKHFNLGSKGEWRYLLRAAREIPGQPGKYEYATTTFTRTSNNPVIINKDR